MKTIRYSYPAFTDQFFGNTTGCTRRATSLPDLFDWVDKALEDTFPFAYRDEHELAADLYEDEANYYARFEVPGVAKSDVKVELEKNTLTVSLEKGEDEDQYSCKRVITLPEPVAADKVSAKLEDGILTVTLEKSDEKKAVTISID